MPAVRGGDALDGVEQDEARGSDGAVQKRLAATRGAPGELVRDNGPELAGKALDQ